MGDEVDKVMSYDGLLMVKQAVAESGDEADPAIANAAAAIRKALIDYPHFCIVKIAGAPDDRHTLLALAKAIANSTEPRESSKEPRGEKKRLSFSHVRVNPESAAAPRRPGTTRYSQTNESMAPHTDSSFDAQPHELVAFQCVIHDENGGESILAPIEDILAHVDDDIIALLRETAYPLGGALHPILSGERHHEEIRYYRTQLNQGLADGSASLPEKYRAAIDALDAVLARSELFHTVHLRSGEILFMQNRKVLHGRTGFSSDSKRYFYRIRLRAPSLGPSAAGDTGR